MSTDGVGVMTTGASGSGKFTRVASGLTTKIHDGTRSRDGPVAHPDKIYRK